MTPWWATIVATALGGVIAGAAGWLNAFMQSRREHQRESQAARRQAYIDFAHRVDVLTRTFGAVLREREKRPGKPEKEERTREIRREATDLDRAVAAIAMSAPSQIANEASDIRFKLTVLLGHTMRGAHDNDLEAVDTAFATAVEKRLTPLLREMEKDLRR
jgi:hypothetical protein